MGIKKIAGLLSMFGIQGVRYGADGHDPALDKLTADLDRRSERKAQAAEKRLRRKQRNLRNAERDPRTRGAR